MGAHAMQHRNMDTAAKAGSGMGMAFMMGAAIGAISGLLFAPKSGREMRDDIKHKTDDMNSKAHDHIEKARSKAHQVTDKMKKKTDNSVDRADDLQAQGEEALQRLESEADKRNRNTRI